MRLATGETREYFYAWRGGPPIRAVPGTAEFISQYHAAHASQLKPKASTLMSPHCRIQSVGGVSATVALQRQVLLVIH